MDKTATKLIIRLLANLLWNQIFGVGIRGDEIVDVQRKLLSEAADWVGKN